MDKQALVGESQTMKYTLKEKEALWRGPITEGLAEQAIDAKPRQQVKPEARSCKLFYVWNPGASPLPLHVPG